MDQIVICFKIIKLIRLDSKYFILFTWVLFNVFIIYQSYVVELKKSIQINQLDFL